MKLKSLLGKSKYLITGVIIGSVLTSGIAYAAGSDYVLSLFQAKLIFNGEEKQGSDKAYMYYNGSEYVPTSLIYNGTTYVPLRFFSESLGQAVKYVGDTETIYVGSTPEDEPIATNMSNILKPYYISSGSFDVSNDITMASKKYVNGYKFGWYSKTKASFNLAGKYSNINGIIGLIDGNNSNDSTIDFYGDDKLITSIQINKGTLPQNFNLNVKGVLKLDIIKNDSTGNQIGLANVMIK